MKRRYIYSVLFGVPGVLVSLLISAAFFGTAVGALWLFVFGDNPWPPVIGQILPALFVLLFVVVWFVIAGAGFLIGRRLEAVPKLNRKHVLLSAIVTVLGILFIVFYQWSAGNLGTSSPETRCAEFCNRQGYPASSVSPRNVDKRTCGCIDRTGSQVIQVPLESVDSGR